MNKRKYVPNVPHLHKICDENYACLMRLLPDCDAEDMTYVFATGPQLKYQIRILESSRYTSLLEMTQLAQGVPEYLRPTMQMRMYHDAQMAEVIQSQHMGALKPSYDYPNVKMHQRNEKEMVNRFLHEWLFFCLTQNKHTTSSNA